MSEEEYINSFDLDKEFKDFRDHYDTIISTSEIDKLKEKFLDLAMSTFFMNRIHIDYEYMVVKYNEFKKIEKENEELKSFIYFIRNFLNIVKDNQQYFNIYHIFVSHSFNVAVPSESSINEILDRKVNSE